MEQTTEQISEIDEFIQNIENEERKISLAIPKEFVASYITCLRNLNTYGLLNHDSVRDTMSSYKELCDSIPKIIHILHTMNSIIREMKNYHENKMLKIQNQALKQVSSPEIISEMQERIVLLETKLNNINTKIEQL